MRKGVQISFLDDVFGFAVVPYYAPGDPVEPAIMPLHDRAECRALVGERATHEFGIVFGSDRRGADPSFMTNFPCCRIRRASREKVPGTEHAVG